MTRIETKVVQSADAEERRICAIEILAAELAVVLLEEGEYGGAIADGGVADAGDAELAGRAQTAEVEGFEGGVGEEEAAIDECVCWGGWMYELDPLMAAMPCGQDRMPLS